MKYKGIIIEESLKDKSVLKKVKILNTEVEAVTENHKTPWLKQWTLDSVEISENEAEEIAEELRKSLETEHAAWYTDFKNESTHFIIFPEKIFKINRKNEEEYLEAKKYGISLGLPEHQLDFSPEIN
ncbi:MAG: hypothetical protein PHQ59_04290 [Candidatus Daviesbacteria bacterium]|nr:hypothetical protein [Candidatus Daviesbacteria bacterium]